MNEQARRLPRLGFLGTGRMGRNRLEAVAKSGVAEIAVICDESQLAAVEARNGAPQAEIVGTYDDLLGAELDGVVIATPSVLHAEQAALALERGLAVFCQNPLGRTSKEVEKVVSAARSADRLLGLDLSYRYTEGMQRVRNLIIERDLGEVYGVELVFHNAHGPHKPWFYKPAFSGGGCVMDPGIHLVDLALWTLEFPRVIDVTSRLYSKGRPLMENMDSVEDYATARLDLSTGISVNLACSWNLSVGKEAIIEASFYGTCGGLKWHNVSGSFHDFAVERYRGTQTETLTSPPGEGHEEWGERAITAWARQLGSNKYFDPEAEWFLDTAAIVDAIYKR